MSGLYFVPVDDSWMDHFDKTVRTPVSLTEDGIPGPLQDLRQARIWGTTDEGQKRSYFERMESGDPILFYNNQEFFAVGRVGQTFEESKIGDWLWGEPDSKFIFTITDFHTPGPSLNQVNQALGYKNSNIPMGFVRPSENALNNLFQTYNSVEEAFQAFKSTRGEPGSTESSSKELVSNDSTVHTEIQYALIQLGLTHSYDVYVAKNDQNREHQGQKLGEDCIKELNIAGFSDATLRIIEYVDVIWLEEDQIVQMFEIESTTSIYSGILRMTDFVVKVPNLAVSMNIVASDEDENKVRREMHRPTFEHALDRSEYSSLNFISFEEVRNRLKIVEEAGPLKTVF